MATLLPGATAWTSLASLPKALTGLRSSIVGDKLRVTGGDQADGKYEVRFKGVVRNWCNAHFYFRKA